MRLVCIGGSDAGISAALRARELEPDVEVTVVVADAYPNFSICGLPFYLSGETPDWRDLAHRTTADLGQAGIHLVLDATVTAVDPDRRRLHIERQDGTIGDLGYDRLVIGTGASPVRPPVEGIDLPGVHLLRTMHDAFAVNDLLDGTRRVAVVGAGYIGMELADALTHRGLDVVLVEMTDTVLPTFDPELGVVLGKQGADHGVDVRTGTTLERIERDGARLRLVTDTAGDISVDAAIVAAGVTPNVGLATGIGVATGAGGALAVDRAMRTGVDGVYAAGDCVHTWHHLLADHVWLPLGTTSHKQGRVAGGNAVDHDSRFAGSLGTQAVKVFDLVAARTGLGHAEAAEHGFDPSTVQLTVDDHKAYYPGATDLHVRLTADRRDGRILGGQLVGDRSAEVSKRVDILATAIFHGMTVDGLSDLDLSYTPPLSAPWDPVQQAAQRAEGQLRSAVQEKSPYNG